MPHSRVAFFIFCLRNLSVRGVGETGQRYFSTTENTLDDAVVTVGGRHVRRMREGAGDRERQEELKSWAKKVAPGAAERDAAANPVVSGGRPRIAHRLGREQLGPIDLARDRQLAPSPPAG